MEDSVKNLTCSEIISEIKSLGSRVSVCDLASAVGKECANETKCSECTARSLQTITGLFGSEINELKEKLENSIELPTDKNGKHIRMGDTVAKPFRGEAIVGIVDRLTYEKSTPKVQFTHEDSGNTYKYDADCVEVIRERKEEFNKILEDAKRGTASYLLNIKGMESVCGSESFEQEREELMRKDLGRRIRELVKESK